MTKSRRNSLRRIISPLALVMLVAAPALDAMPASASPGAAETANTGRKPQPERTTPSRPAAGWASMVVATPQGGVRIGNPRARARLIEYGSLTCHVCGDFANESRAVLIDRYVASGTVSFEFRSYLRNAVDVAGSLGMACLPTKAYFPFLHRLFAEQPAMLAKLEAITPEQSAQVNALTMLQRLRALANMAGLTPMFAHAGIGSERLNACMADKPALTRLETARHRVNYSYNIEGTPFFLLNDAPLHGVTSWSGVDAALKSLGV